jgi:hypothetical protein
MSDSFTRPYVQDTGGEPRIVYLTDRDFERLSLQGTVRPLEPTEAARIFATIGIPAEPVAPEVVGETQIAPSPLVRQGEAADTAVGDVEAHPVPEVREREVD